MARNESKYFTRAAHKLQINQPMLTRNIAELEASFGFQLFDRTAKRCD